MITNLTFDFLSALKENNDRTWFEENRKKYEVAKGEVENLIQAVIDEAPKWDDSVPSILAKKAMFRINRDVRFGADKSPYKVNMGAGLGKSPKHKIAAGYYIHIEPNLCFCAGGMWMPMPEVLSMIRQEINYDFSVFKGIVESAEFEKHFPNGLSQENKLTRPPKGYEIDNPAIDYLKLKSFTVSKGFSHEEMMSENIVEGITKTFEALRPLIDFLNKVLEVNEEEITALISKKFGR
jgi:uncharacterized protein (TIGR02453 family)